MIFRQLYDGKSSTYTYLLADSHSKEGVLIDPVFEQVNRDIALLKELGITLKYAIDTHCHADHVTAAWMLKNRLGCQIANAKAIGADNTDWQLAHGDTIQFGDEQLEVRATPGHTDGCLTYVDHKNKRAFTGDALLIRGCGRSDFQQGDAAHLFDSIKGQILSLNDDYMLYPGHDYSGRMATSVAEEKAYNARLGGNASKEDFVGYMNNMKLPHPKFIDIALPANLKSGKPDEMPAYPNWAPVEYTFSGVYEITANWTANHLDAVTVLDVREPQELNEGRIAGSVHIPLGELSERLETIPKDKPIVTLCRSGRRSALAAGILTQAGFDNVANIKGGILEWEMFGLPLERAGGA